MPPPANTDGWFAVVPNFLTSDNGLSDAAFRIMVGILGATYRDGRCTLTNRQLGEFAGGKSYTRVSSHLKELEGRGYILCEFTDDKRARRSGIRSLLVASKVPAHDIKSDIVRPDPDPGDDIEDDDEDIKSDIVANVQGSKSDIVSADTISEMTSYDIKSDIVPPISKSINNKTPLPPKGEPEGGVVEIPLGHPDYDPDSIDNPKSLPAHWRTLTGGRAATDKTWDHVVNRPPDVSTVKNDPAEVDRVIAWIDSQQMRVALNDPDGIAAQRAKAASGSFWIADIEAVMQEAILKNKGWGWAATVLVRWWQESKGEAKHKPGVPWATTIHRPGDPTPQVAKALREQADQSRVEQARRRKAASEAEAKESILRDRWEAMSEERRAEIETEVTKANPGLAAFPSSILKVCLAHPDVDSEINAKSGLISA